VPFFDSGRTKKLNDVNDRRQIIHIMNPAIFICSHIHYEGQLGLLKRCLNSLLNQEEAKSNICVSISVDPKYKKAFKKKVKGPYKDRVNFHVQPGQFSQIEHLFELTKLYGKKHDLVMFCDDDDTYKPNRVAEFVKVYNQIDFDNFSMKNIYISGIRDIVEYDNGMPEYWSYGVRPQILEEFFQKFVERDVLHYLKNKFADMFLRNFIYMYKRTSGICFTIKLVLYEYNSKNPYGICNTKTENSDNLFGLIISLYDPDLLTDFVKMKDIYLRHKELVSGIDTYMFYQSLFEFKRYLYSNNCDEPSLTALMTGSKAARTLTGPRLVI
jgi:hypothetical protein